MWLTTEPTLPIRRRYIKTCQDLHMKALCCLLPMGSMANTACINEPNITRPGSQEPLLSFNLR